MFRVVIAGLRGAELIRLRGRLPGGVQVRAIELRRLLRVRTLRPDLVLCTRFLSHKHTLHLESITDSKVVYSPGGVGSWTNLIRAEYALAGRAVPPGLAI